MQYFNTAFSDLLVFYTKAVWLINGGDKRFFRAKISKRVDNGLARVTRGWAAFVDEHGFNEGDMVVVCLRERPGRVLMRVFVVDGA